MVSQLRRHPSFVWPGKVVGYCVNFDNSFVHGVIEHIYEKACCKDPMLCISGPYGKDYVHLSEVFDSDIPAWRYKNLPFYEVTAKDNICLAGDPLLDGEQKIMHGQLTKLNHYKDKRNHHKDRYNPPWICIGPPQSKHEKWKRKQCLNLYRAGLDDCIPPMLLKTGSWSTFWFAYSNLPHIKEEIAKKGST